MTAADALYVYGVVRSDTPADVFAGVEGMGDGPVRLVGADGVAAIASSVPLAELDTDALELNLKDGAWLEQKVQAHNRVLAAAVRKATVLPLRFGAIYRGEDQVRTMLGERPELEAQLARLDGLLAFGVKGLLDPAALPTRLGARAATAGHPGRARRPSPQQGGRVDRRHHAFGRGRGPRLRRAPCAARVGQHARAAGRRVDGDAAHVRARPSSGRSARHWWH